MTDESGESLLPPGAVAAMFGVSVGTVANWAESGKLAYFRTPGGQRRFRRSDVEALLAAGRPTDEPTAASA